MNTFLSKRNGILALGALLLLDTLFDVARGTQGNPLYKPIENAFGITVFPLLVPIALLFFYIIVKIAAWLIAKVERTKHSEEIMLTTLVIIFAVHDAWVFSVDYLGFNVINSYIQMIPIYIAVGLAYSLWAENKGKK